VSTDWARLFADPLLAAYARVSAVLPSLSAAFLLLLAGMFLARFARMLVETVLTKIRLDDLTSRAGLNELLARLGLGRSPTTVAAFVIYWLLIVVFVVTAANALNMTAVSELLERFSLFLPALVSAVLIVFGGLLFARLLSQVLINASEANTIRGGRAVAAAAYVVVVGYSSLAALEQIGAKPALVLSTAQILVGSLGLALAIAFGLGAKDIAGEILRDVLRRKR